MFKPILYNEIWKNYAIFPCKKQSKQPATIHGYKDAKFNQNVLDLIKQGYNVGLAVAQSHLIVIDIDYHDINSTADTDIKKLEIELGENLPRTLTQSTASGKGRHLIFSDEGIIGKPKGKIGKYCDVKYNGYIMIAPSICNNRMYQIIDGINEFGEVIISKLPKSWLAYLNQKEKKPDNITNFQNLPKREYANINLDKVFKNCNFLKYCIDEDNASELEEPMWHSMISILAQIKDSDELIHELSSPYPKYSFKETQNKINNARKFGHPQSCKYISMNYPNVCSDCISAILQKGENYGK